MLMLLLETEAAMIVATSLVRWFQLQKQMMRNLLLFFSSFCYVRM